MLLGGSNCGFQGCFSTSEPSCPVSDLYCMLMLPKKSIEKILAQPFLLPTPEPGETEQCWAVAPGCCHPQCVQQRLSCSCTASGNERKVKGKMMDSYEVKENQIPYSRFFKLVLGKREVMIGRNRGTKMNVH